MGSIGILAIIIIAANVFLSSKAFKDFSFFNQYSFYVDRILIQKEYIRMVSSGFLHVNWMHLIFNMMTLYFFSGGVENIIGSSAYLMIYVGSLLGGNALALYVHKNHGDYTAVGASGAVSGIVYASIALFPGGNISFILLPMIEIPTWIYGVGYVLYTIYGIKSQKDNIGHEAHLGGALAGLLIALFICPTALTENTLTIVLILVPSVFFLYLLLTNPAFLLLPGAKPIEKKKIYSNNSFTDMINSQKEVDALLDKINKKGYDKLSKKEKARLKELTDKK